MSMSLNEYLDYLLSTEGVTLDRLGTTRDGLLDGIETRRELNTRLFGLIDKWREAAPTSPPLTFEVESAIASLISRKRDGIVSSFKERIDAELESIAELAGRIERARTSIGRAALELETFETDGDSRIDMAGQIERIERAGFWTLWRERCTSTELLFHTPPEVFCLSNVPDAIPIGMGQYAARVSLESLALSLWRVSANRRPAEGNMHPFVSGTGICWGNRSNEVGRLTQQLSLEGLLAELETLLTRYDKDSGPYLGLQYFENAPRDPVVDIYATPDEPATPSDATPSVPTSCPECNSTDIISGESDSSQAGAAPRDTIVVHQPTRQPLEPAEFYVCNDCGHDWI